MSEESGDELGIGLYRGPSAIPDDLRPGQPPHPSEGTQGPPMAPGLIGWDEHLKSLEVLGRAMATAGFNFVTNTVNGNTDSSGVLSLAIYQVAAGDEAMMSTLTFNALNPSTGLAYNSAVPYSSASAYVKLFEAEGNASNDLGHSGLIAFGPDAAGDPIFPGIIEAESEKAAGFVRGPNWYILRIVGGPVSAQVFARYQVWKRRMVGVA